MAKGCNVEIAFFDCLDSTQTWLVAQLRQNALQPPFAVCAKCQTHGIGSRGNRWDNAPSALLFSFALAKQSLPHDLPLHASALYFGWLFKDVLAERGSRVWLKYPNDLYIGTQKAGGVIVQVVGETLVCGIGLNLDSGQYGALEPEVPRDGLLEKYLAKDFARISWKQIFSNYRLEFANNEGFSFHHRGILVPLKEAELRDDGTLFYHGEILFNARFES